MTVRKLKGVVIGMAACLLVPGWAHAQGGTDRLGVFGGFGGLTIDAGTSSPNLGGTLTFALTPHVHLLGEAGRLGNVLPSRSDALFSLADVRASAFYGEGGVRFLFTPHATVTPYAEGTAGVARIGVSTPSLGSVGNLLVPTALSFVPRTGPVAGAGGGVLLHAGRAVFDLGYRYKQLYPPPALEAALGLGERLRSHQLRVGVGIGF